MRFAARSCGRRGRRVCRTAANDNRRREQISRHDPRQAVEPAEFADDSRQRRRHDGLIERGEQHDEQQRREQQAKRRPFRDDFDRSGRVEVHVARSGLKLINTKINISDILSFVKCEASWQQLGRPSKPQRASAAQKSAGSRGCRIRRAAGCCVVRHTCSRAQARPAIGAARAVLSNARACSTLRSCCSPARASSIRRSVRSHARRATRRLWCITTSRTRDQLLDVLIDERFLPLRAALTGAFTANGGDPVAAITQLARGLGRNSR